MFAKRLIPIRLVSAVLILILASIPFNLGFANWETGTIEPSNPQDTQIVPISLNGEIRISDPTNPEAERYLPAVAYNPLHKEYLVVWHNVWPGGHRDIYARRVSESGQLLSWFAVSAGANDRAQPDVVYNAATDEYLVVWMYNANGDGSTYEIWGRTISWNGGYQNPEFQIITWPNRSFWTPKAAWNSVRNEYMVVWNAADATTLVPTDVAHAILAANGNKLFGAIVSDADQPHQTDITYNSAKNDYLVVWRRMQAPADGDIMAARLGGFSGQKITPPGIITVSDTAQDQRRPAVATNHYNRYVVVWEHAYPGPCCDWDIRSRELDNNGSLLGSENIEVGSTNDETSPAIAVRKVAGLEYVVAFQQHISGDERVQAIRSAADGRTSFEVAGAAFWDHETPAVAMGPISSLITYSGDTGGDPNIHRHIFARRWVPGAIFLPVTFSR